MIGSKNVTHFWADFCDASAIDPATPYQVWSFGNSPEMASELAGLVMSGTKTATASLFETNKLKPGQAPVDAGYSVVTTYEGEPLCVIQTAEIRYVHFCNVDAEVAYDEGEDDRTLGAWRKGHLAYFTREAAECGFDFDENSIVCCERFRLLFPK